MKKKLSPSHPLFPPFLSFPSLFLSPKPRGHQKNLSMADESEMRMEELKKAYAEIILNTSKEAAARVMVAQRKALCFERDLSLLKEESLRMLLRIKDDFNAKITEAEAKSLNQQMKVEELEAQLSEAEGIIVDLRDELKQVQDELEIIRHNQVKPLHGRIHGEDEPVLEFGLQANTLGSSVNVNSDATTSISQDAEMRQTVQSNKCLDAMANTNSSIKSIQHQSHLDQSSAGNDEITSIILQNRDTNLYRNFCTQRIRACERNLANEKLAISRAENKQSLINVQADPNAGEADNGSRYPVMENAHVTSNPAMFTDMTDSANQDHLMNVCTVQYREKKSRKSREKLKRSCSKMRKMSGRGSESHLRVVNDNVQSCEEPCSAYSSKTEKKNAKKISDGLKGQLLLDCRCYKDQAIRSLTRSAGKNARYREAIAALRKNSRRKSLPSLQPPFLCQCKVKGSGGNVQSVEVPIEILESKAKKPKVCFGSECDDMNPTGEIKHKNNEVTPCRGFENLLSAEQSKVTAHKSFPVPVDTQLVDLELVDVPISEGFGSPRRAGENDRLLKFTFHRRCRKNVLAKVDENIVHDVSTVKTRLKKPTSVNWRLE